MRKSILLLLLTLFVCSAHAREIAGVTIAETTVVPGVVEPLNLNGVAIRSKFFFKIYIAALYVTETSHDANILLVSSSARRMMMHMLYNEVEKEKLTRAWTEGFEKNLPAALFAAIKPRLERFNDMFSTLHKDDVALIDFVPGVGTRVTIRGAGGHEEVRGVIEGADFYRAVLSVWIGDEPATEDLKAGVLGVEK
jgi:hypothetical protein